MTRLKDKVALITGGANGLGEAIAQHFTKEGATVYVADIVAPNHSFGKYIQMDVTNQESVNNIIKTIIEKHHKIDCLVNNAGIICDALVEKMTIENWQKVIDVNLTGVFRMTQAVLPYMYEKQQGSIINISSIVGEYGNIGQSNYAASKAGVIGLTYTWAKEFSRKGAQIRTNAIAPGYAQTSMMDSVPDKILDNLKNSNPLKRIATPDDIANTAVFLASDEASYINGQVIGVNGGARL